MTKKMRAADVELITLHEISKALRSTPELSKTLHSVVDVLSKQLGVSHAMVTLVRPSGDLELVASSGTADGTFGHSAPAGDSASKQRPMSLVGVPIKACGQDLGVLSCARPHGEVQGTFQRDVRLLSIVANLIGEVVKFPEGTAPREGEDATSKASRVH
jgi:transcriptional regulator with GAF, ATPase, and Fis domain